MDCAGAYLETKLIRYCTVLLNDPIYKTCFLTYSMNKNIP